MTKYFLNSSYISPGLQEMRGKAVAKCVRRHSFVDSGFLDSAMQSALENTFVHMVTMNGTVVRILAMAHAFGIPIMPDVWGSDVVIAVDMHLVSVIPDLPDGAPVPANAGIRHDVQPASSIKRFSCTFRRKIAGTLSEHSWSLYKERLWKTSSTRLERIWRPKANAHWRAELMDTRRLGPWRTNAGGRTS